MPYLYIHVGHMKTGSSWIQSCFRYNRDVLLKNGIEYVNGNDAKVTDPCTITSGNFANLLSSEETFDDILNNCTLNSKSSLLFSSELIFFDLNSKVTEQFIVNIAKKYGFAKIEILLFIRNPISLAVSQWQQSIKRGGEFNTDISNIKEKELSLLTEDFFGVADILKYFEKNKDVRITVINYSRNKNRLVEIVTSWLKLPSNSIAPPPFSRINRSMTISELKMQQILNKILGKSGNLLSDPLCERLPDIEPSQIYLPKDVQEFIWQKVLPSIKSINSRIPDSQHYECDILETEPVPEIYTFTNDQIKVITESLGGEIKRLKEENAKKGEELMLNNKLLEQIFSSKSWNVTKPLRYISSFFKNKSLIIFNNGQNLKSINTKVVYTIILGDYDTLKEPEIVNPDFDYICFTDQKDIKSEVWQFKYVKCNKKINLKRNAAKFITIPFKYLKDYKLSVLVGGQTSIHCDIGNFVEKVLPENKSIAIMVHPKRDYVYEEAKVVVELEKDNFVIINKQMQRYRDYGYPEHSGLISSGIMVRRHNDRSMIKHCKLWYKEIKRYSQRDQLSFNFIMWKYRLIEPAYFSPLVRVSDFKIHSHNFLQKF